MIDAVPLVGDVAVMEAVIVSPAFTAKPSKACETSGYQSHQAASDIIIESPESVYGQPITYHYN